MVVIAKYPEIAATKNPTIIGPIVDGSIPALIALGNSKIAEPSIAGIDIRKANSTANSLFKPVTRLPTIVDPDLEIPGIMASP